MSIKTGDNFLYRGKKPLDSRDTFDTILAMTTFNESSLDDGHISYVKETDKHYKFNSANEVDMTLGKWREFNGSGSSVSDGKVKLDSTADAKYLNELLDDATIKIDETSKRLVVKKIDGQTVTVAEINFLTGVTSNIQEQINNLGKAMTMYGVFGTKAELLASTTPAPVDGNTAIVVADEDNDNKQMTYIYIASNSAWAQVAESSVNVRDFSTNPIDLSTETTGTLPKDKIDEAVARLADVLDKATYKGSDDGVVKQADKLTGLTATIAALNQAVSDDHTHANKAILDKIVSDGIGSRFLADNGKYIEILHIGTTPPTYNSQIWIDNTDSSKPILKIYDGTDWITVSGAADLRDFAANPIDLTTEVKSPEFTQATTRENIASKESIPTLFGKIKKYFTDLKTHAFNTPANNLTTTEEGYALDARQGKVLNDKLENAKLSANTLLQPTTVTSTLTKYETYNSRKISDYSYFIIGVYVDEDCTDLRYSITVPRHMWTRGNMKINHAILHGGSGLSVGDYNVTAIYIEYSDDTSFKIKVGASGILKNFEISGYKFDR